MITISLETKEIMNKGCNFCGQKRLLFNICEPCKDELLHFQLEKEISFTVADYQPFMKTLYWSCNLFLGFIEQFDETTTSFRDIPTLKKDLQEIVFSYKPTTTPEINNKLLLLIKSVANKLNVMKRFEFDNPSDRKLFHTFPIMFYNFYFSLELLSKII